MQNSGRSQELLDSRQRVPAGFSCKHKQCSKLFRIRNIADFICLLKSRRLGFVNILLCLPRNMTGLLQIQQQSLGVIGTWCPRGSPTSHRIYSQASCSVRVILAQNYMQCCKMCRESYLSKSNDACLFFFFYYK